MSDTNWNEFWRDLRREIANSPEITSLGETIKELARQRRMDKIKEENEKYGYTG